MQKRQGFHKRRHFHKRQRSRESPSQVHLPCSLVPMSLVCHKIGPLLQCHMHMTRVLYWRILISLRPAELCSWSPSHGGLRKPLDRVLVAVKVHHRHSRNLQAAKNTSARGPEKKRKGNITDKYICKGTGEEEERKHNRQILFINRKV
jgi:hypothetical protein